MNRRQASQAKKSSPVLLSSDEMQRAIQSCNRRGAAKGFERGVDGRRHGRARHSNSNGLRNLTHSHSELCRELVDRIVKRGCLPLRQGCELVSRGTKGDGRLRR